VQQRFLRVHPRLSALGPTGRILLPAFKVRETAPY
jgi:hypothetical protein